MGPDGEMRRRIYIIAVPLMLLACVIAVIVNSFLTVSACFIRRSLSPTLMFSLSLAAANAQASLVVAIGLVLNSYIPFVYGMNLGPYQYCYILTLEAFRMAALIVSVLHLLALAVNHTLGIVRPLHYAATMTKRTTSCTLAVVWICPLVFFFVYFSSVPGQGFQADKCSKLDFLGRLPFRIVTTVLFFTPLCAMCVMYGKIFLVVRRHQQGELRDSRALSANGLELNDHRVATTRHMRKSVKAVVTTLLILGTYLLGWMPATVFFAVSCLECPFPYPDIPIEISLAVGIASNSLVVFKALIDPVVYVARMPEIKNALKKMWRERCGCRQTVNGSDLAMTDTFRIGTQRCSTRSDQTRLTVRPRPSQL